MSTVIFNGALLSKNVSVLKSSTAIPPFSYTFELVYTLSNPNPFDGYTSAVDNFAVTTATSNTYTIVGAPLEDSVDGTNGGAAYIYSNATGQLLHTLANPNNYGTVASDSFGVSVAINESYAVVGASGEADASGVNSGKVYVYSMPSGNLVYTIANPSGYSTGTGDYFGYKVAISNNYFIVGAYSEDDASGLNSGKAYVYSLSNGQLVYTLNNPNATSTTASDFFGASVAITDTHAIVGAYQEDVGGSSSGSAYIFSMSNGQLLYTLNNPNGYSTAANDFFGRSVAISSTHAMVGADGEDDASGTLSGKVYAYTLSNGQLAYTLNDPNPVSTSKNDYFGATISMTDTLAIISAHGEGTAFGAGASYPSAGKAYVYNVSNGSLVYTLDNPNDFSTPNTDFFSGTAVGISNNYISVGASEEDSSVGGATISSSGRIYIYSASTGQLLHTKTNPNSYGSSDSDMFSRTSVSTSSMYTVVGAYGEDTVAMSGSGKAYIFSNSTGQLLTTLDSPAEGSFANPSFGRSVSNTNNYVAIGTPGYSSFGRAYIYTTQGALLHTITSPITANQTYFGGSIDITDTHFIVGAILVGASGGRAYIYSTTTGELLHTLINPNPYSTGSGDNFGFSVRITDNYAIVGAYQEDDASGTNSGKAYIYSVTTGALLYTLNNPNPYGTSTDDWFGYSVDIAGNYAIVGAPQEDDDATNLDSGKAYIYSTATGSLVYTLTNPNTYPSVADLFGWSVAICDNYAIVGAFAEDDASGSSSGKAYIYSLSNGQLVYTLDNPNPIGTSASDYFGESVSISNNHAVVGAYGEDDQSGGTSGKVYLYTLP